MKITGFICFVLLLHTNSFCYATRKFSMDPTDQLFGVHSYLSRFNKSPLKTIQSPDGDIIDCVDIYNQPAFDHPLLKNHTLQMRPNYNPVNKLFPKRNNDVDETITRQLWQKNGHRCPDGTIPIRRTTKHDLLRAESMERFGKKTPGSIPMSKSFHLDMDNPQEHEHAIGFVEGAKYLGAKATLNLWRPQTESPDEFSLAQIWILGGTFGPDINSIEVGWQVCPILYGDDQTRLFTYWTGDNYQSTGCYNLLCSGFVQTNKDIVLGGSINPVSTYSGPQFEFSVFVWKHPQDGNWWLQVQKEVVGYWPASLFTHLKDSANMIQFGGEIINKKQNGMHTATQMGSGHFSEEGITKASFFSNLQVVDESNILRDVVRLKSHTDGQTGCYNVNIDGRTIYYGGPGRNIECP